MFEEGAAGLEDRETVRAARLSELFEPGKGSLVLYSFMYGPKMKRPCPMCTSLIDGFDGTASHVRERAGKVHHFWSAEALFVEPEPGQDPRHVDSVWALWNLLDLTPEGRGVG